MQHDPILYEEVNKRYQERLHLIETMGAMRRKMIETIADAESRREFEERVPPISLNSLLLPNNAGVLEWMEKTSVPITALAERSGEGKAVVDAWQAMMGTFGGASQIPLRTADSAARVDEAVNGAARKADESLADILRLTEVGPSSEDPNHTNEVLERRALPSPIPQADVEECKKVEGVNLKLKDDAVIAQIRFKDGEIMQVRLILYQFDDYPDFQPVVKEFKVTTRDGEEKPVLPRNVTLHSLEDWGSDSRLVDIIREITDNNGQVFH